MAKRRLTQQQRRRIASIREKRLARADQHAAAELHQGVASPKQLTGRIITRHGRNLIIEDQTGRLYPCLFRQNIGHAVCGDLVRWQPTGDNQGVVTALENRHSTLIRPDYSGQDKPLASHC